MSHSLPTFQPNTKIFFFPKSVIQRCPGTPASMVMKELSFQEEQQAYAIVSAAMGQDRDVLSYGMKVKLQWVFMSLIKWGDKKVVPGMVDYRVCEDTLSAQDIFDSTVNEVRELIMKAYQSLNSQTTPEAETKDFLLHSQVVV